MKALVVDDEGHIRRLLVRVLDQQGWQAGIAKNGQDALAAVDAALFDIAFIDVNLWDGMGGIALARKLREREPRLRIIMMSGDPGNAVNVHQAGLGDMLAKPFDVPLIVSLLGRPSSRG